ncbi:hypothetical protein [Candidatus Magnetominusculus xianensis]|uniref:Uncharacterized protein n=1 Tax=Candidatus Magnetominusculus xianensis TaxID=1748249 RepID=A0ABR5SB08_9BACT|nr:hypothetical protein [Candidatus Magnetominusculus xianensis]KWT75622.1 hypothetical protein ASN18_3222 [Candidatus Magnetominusculus xianensis]MBF0403705.1 hypothetical protein [Nitrospirota bacterium]
MNKCDPFLHTLKDMDSRFRGNDSRGKAVMTAERRFFQKRPRRLWGNTWEGSNDSRKTFFPVCHSRENGNPGCYRCSTLQHFAIGSEGCI